MLTLLSLLGQAACVDIGRPLSVDHARIRAFAGQEGSTASIDSTTIVNKKKQTAPVGPPGPVDSTGSLPPDTLDAPPDDGQGALAARPDPPRAFLSFQYPALTGRTIVVGAADNFQSALNNAQRGDEIVLAAGATWEGNFILPAKSGTAADGWIVVRGEQASRLAPPGTRVLPADAAVMPKIVTPNPKPALAAAQNASGWWLVGLELTVQPLVREQQYGVLWLGEGGAPQLSLASVPSDIVVDRMYIHGQTTTNMSRCIALNSARTQISDSFITECHGKGFDSQAILGWNGPGPYKIVNNMLAGAGENVMFGGADPAISGLVPSDIEIRKNHFYTPLSWKGVWTKKNLLELKNASRVLIEGNVFDGSWVDGQTGTAIMFRSANQDGRCRWCRTTDVTFRRNYVTHAAGAITLIGGGNSVDTTLRRILITESVFDSIGVAPYTGEQRGFQFIEGPSDITIDQTIVTGSLNLLMYVDRNRPAQRVEFRNSIWRSAAIVVDGIPRADQALSIGMPGFRWSGIGIFGGSGGSFPPGTSYLGSESQSAIAARIRSVVRFATFSVVTR